MKTSNLVIFLIFAVLTSMIIIVYATNKKAEEPFENTEIIELTTGEYPEEPNASAIENKERINNLTDVVKALKTNQDILKIPNLTEAEKDYMEALIATKDGIQQEQLDLLAKQVLALDIRVNKTPGNLI